MLNEDDDRSSGGSLPDPSRRHWRHPSEVGGLSEVAAPAVGDRAFSINSLAAFGTLAFGGTAAALLYFAFTGSSLATDTGFSMTEAEIGNKTEVAVFADKTMLTLPDQGPAVDLKSFSQADVDNTGHGGENAVANEEVASNALTTTGIFSGRGSAERLASFLVFDNMVLTSASSLSGRPAVWLALDDRWVEASVVGVDPYTDVAVLEPVEWFDALAEIAVEPSTVEAGRRVRLDPVTGESPDEIRSIWSGVVSRTDDMAMTGDGRRWYGVLSMSMPWDDSVPGSAVLTENGDAVGMAINSPASLTSAVPLETAADVARSLAADGVPNKAWIGVEVATDGKGKTRLVAIDPASPASDVLKPGDILFSVEGVTLDHADHLVFAVREVGPENGLELVVRRDGHLYPVVVPVGTAPSVSGD